MGMWGRMRVLLRSLPSSRMEEWSAPPPILYFNYNPVYHFIMEAAKKRAAKRSFLFLNGRPSPPLSLLVALPFRKKNILRLPDSQLHHK